MSENLTFDQILSVDGGESYILSILPELQDCFDGWPKKIKVASRDDDKTPSTGIFKHRESGHWMVKDFGGGENKAKSAISLCMEHENCDGSEAFKLLAKFYGHKLTTTAEPKPSYSSRAATADDQPGEIKNLKFRDLKESDYRLIFSAKTWKELQWNGVTAKDDKARNEHAKALFTYYRCKALISYEHVAKDGSKVHIWEATETFPMYAIDETEFKKIYRPLATKLRFMYAGQKPDRYLHGLAQHKKYLDENKAKNNKADVAMEMAEPSEDGSAEAAAEKDKLPERFPEVILCSGFSDAINVAGCGFRTVWKNSESDDLETSQMKSLRKMAFKVLQLQDLDATGMANALKIASQYLDIHTIILPQELLKYAGNNGKRMKDVRDYLRKWSPYNFKKLVDQALPFKFWDEMKAMNESGTQKMRFGRPQWIYEFNQVRGYNFLQMNGFWRLEEPKEKNGFLFIHIKDQIVKKVEAQDIKDYITSFLKERQMPEDLRNKIYKTPYLNDQSLANLEYFKPNFQYYGADFQYFCFEEANGSHSVYKVTKNSLEPVKVNDVYFWEHKILKIETERKGKLKTGNFKKMDTPFFKAFKEEGEWKLELSEESCDFMKFLIGTSRLHWQAELEERMDFYKLNEEERENYAKANNLAEEDIANLLSFGNKKKQEAYAEKYRWRLDGALLTPEERAEQELCFINRVFVIGYLLHRHKDDARPWAAFLMDYKVSEESASNGRAGKGLIAKALYRFMKHFHRDGRKQGLLDYEHIWDGVDENTELIHLEDWDHYQPFPRLFTTLTSSLTSNPKGKQQVTYSYTQYGKFLIDTNFADKYTDGSSKGRKIYSVFSDYFHEDLEQYNEVRTPITELGRRLYDKRDWDTEEWNRFYNFMIQCLQFYLATAEKIDPPFSNITKRNNLALMGENFQSWADNYFENHFNTEVDKIASHEDCRKVGNMQKLTSHSFMKKLIAWCEFNDYELNPMDVDGWMEGGKRSNYGLIKKNVPKEGSITELTSRIFLHIRNRHHPSWDDKLPFD